VVRGGLQKKFWGGKKGHGGVGKMRKKKSQTTKGEKEREEEIKETEEWTRGGTRRN